jgi:hypothetical protein
LAGVSVGVTPVVGVVTLVGATGVPGVTAAAVAGKDARVGATVPRPVFPGVDPGSMPLAVCAEETG